MHDIKSIRKDFQKFDNQMVSRGVTPNSAKLRVIDEHRRDIIRKRDVLAVEHNEISDRIGYLRRNNVTDQDLEERGKYLRTQCSFYNEILVDIEKDLDAELSVYPNILKDDVPFGKSENDNVVIKTHGAIPTFDFTVKDHVEIGEKLGLLNFTISSKLSGPRFSVLTGKLAKLERALCNYMLDYLTTKDFQEVSVPVLVNERAMYGTGQLPKFENDLFKTTDGRYLIPTAEVPITNLFADEIMPYSDRPYHIMALTDCFRKEAGSAGKDTRGMLRQHQFKKVEMVSVCHPDLSDHVHELMTLNAEHILEELGLPYRRVLLCSGDTGFSSAKTYDLEVWIPSQNTYREISSVSNCLDFQSRRMNMRMKHKDAKHFFPHTLNGSALAIGRTIISIMENYQTADGNFDIPDVLNRYM